MSDPASGRSFRFSLRMLFVTVTILAVFFATSAVVLRAFDLKAKSERHMQIAGAMWNVVETLEKQSSRTPAQETLLQKMHEKFDEHASYSMECEEAMWRPWVTLPDKPKQ